MAFLRYFHRNITKARQKQFVPALNGYARFVKRYFLYEYGLEDFFERVGFPGVELPHIGLYPDKPENLVELYLTQEAKEFIDENFPEEVALYKQLREDYGDPYTG